jgi:hypothetical protein
VIVYALAVVTALTSTAFQPAQAARLPALARSPEELTAANATSTTLESVGFVTGHAPSAEAADAVIAARLGSAGLGAAKRLS